MYDTLMCISLKKCTILIQLTTFSILASKYFPSYLISRYDNVELLIVLFRKIYVNCTFLKRNTTIIKI